MGLVRAGTRVVAVVLAAGMGVSCASFGDPLGRRQALEDIQRRYTQLVRWGEYEEASEFVSPELRDAFVDRTAAFERFRITDYQIGRISYEDEPDAATVKVTYRGYSMASLVESPIEERQNWYRESGNAWRVRSEFGAPVGAIGR